MKKRIRQSSPSRRTRFESLEDRRVLAATVVPMDPTGQGRESWQQQVGSVWTDFTAEAFKHGNGHSLIFTAKTTGEHHVTFNQAGAQVQILYKGQSMVAAVSTTSNIVFTGGDGADTFINNTNLESGASGGNGRDTLIGGSNTDHLYGGGHTVRSFNNDFDTFQPDDKAGDILKGNGGDDWLIGGQGNDDLEGGAGDDLIYGFEGIDNLKGGEDDDEYGYTALPGTNTNGSDIIDDSFGDNRLDFLYVERAVQVDLSKPGGGVVIAGMSVNILNPNYIEEVRGTDFNDVLRGNGYRNVFRSEGGSDILEGRGADDVLWGDEGNDTYVFSGKDLGNDTIRDYQSSFSTTPTNTLDFTNFGVAVRIDLARSGAQLIAEDELSLSWENSNIIANVIGSAYGDLIYGNSLKNKLEGRGGADRIEGRAGDDTMIGGSNNDRYVFQDDDLGNDIVTELETSTGIDSLDYRLRGTGVEVGLNKSSVQNINLDGEGGSTLKLSNATSMEVIYGTEEDDILRGNLLENIIFGMKGDDTISGYSGNDTLWGMDNNDRIFGGYDHDELLGGKHQNYLAGFHGNDVYDIYSDGTNEIVDESGTDTLDFRDLPYGIRLDMNLSNYQDIGGFLNIKFAATAIERVYGSQHNDRIIGNNLDNRLSGQSGDDTIYGRAGKDLIYGGTGNDGIYGGADADTIYAGSNADRVLVTTLDIFNDHNANDAKLLFRNGNKQWATSEIEKLDAGFAALHHRTGNTVLLKRQGGLITFERNTASTTSSDAAADNEGNGTINVYNLTYVPSETTVAEIAVHEIAHNWDDAAYSAPSNAQLYNEFTRLSGWQNTSGPNKTLGSAGWYYTTGTEFARDYGKENLYEDVATCFEVYFYGSSADRTRIAAKLAVVDRFMNAMSG